MNKRKLTVFVVLLSLLLIIQPISVSALTSGEAKLAWYDAKEQSREAQEIHRQAKVTWAADQTPGNNQLVIDSGKEALSAALDEAEAWLIWKNIEVSEDPGIPDDLKITIQDDVEQNLAKIDDLREDVDAIETRFDLGIAFLKIVGKYLELLTDVARNTGLVWVHIATTHAETIETYEGQLRDAAGDLPDNDPILERLDMAHEELEEARTNIQNAKNEYNQVQLPGTPLILFSNGNSYLKIARGNMLSAHGYLNQAFNLIVGGGRT
jgi:hypothetical protein